MTVFLLVHSLQCWTYCRTVDARTSEVWIGVIASMWCDFQSLHSRALIPWLFQEIDLERTAQELLVSEKFQKLCIIFGTTADETHGLAPTCAVLDFFAAVVETTLVLRRPDIIKLRNNRLA